MQGVKDTYLLLEADLTGTMKTKDKIKLAQLLQLPQCARQTLKLSQFHSAAGS